MPTEFVPQLAEAAGGGDVVVRQRRATITPNTRTRRPPPAASATMAPMASLKRWGSGAPSTMKVESVSAAPRVT
ncbi:MAG: hypothetical protein M3N68_03850 [Actinomycetota bacterium]|nr:hypothetical protein [Actinomycetota bacterium]